MLDFSAVRCVPSMPRLRFFVMLWPHLRCPRAPLLAMLLGCVDASLPMFHDASTSLAMCSLDASAPIYDDASASLAMSPGAFTRDSSGMRRCRLQLRCVASMPRLRFIMMLRPHLRCPRAH